MINLKAMLFIEGREYPCLYNHTSGHNPWLDTEDPLPGLPCVGVLRLEECTGPGETSYLYYPVDINIGHGIQFIARKGGELERSNNRKPNIDSR